MSERPPAWLGFLDEPGQHAFIPSPADSIRCFTCNQRAEEHPVELEARERRLAEARERERYGRRADGWQG